MGRRVTWLLALGIFFSGLGVGGLIQFMRSRRREVELKLIYDAGIELAKDEARIYRDIANAANIKLNKLGNRGDA